MKELTLMFGNVLEAVLECNIDERSGMSFSKEAKELISGFSKLARDTELYKHNELTGRNFTNGMTVEEIWTHMNQKLLEAPTTYHMISVVILMVPFADELINGEVDYD